MGANFEACHPLLSRDKLELIDFAFSRWGIQSFADLGGMWRVEGGYTVYCLETYPITSAALVDFHFAPSVVERSQKWPQLALIQGNFGDERIADQVGTVDAVLLFDVLLHQVAPDWDRILELYAPRSRCFLVHNPQWVGSGPAVRLLELGEEAYFQNVPHEPTEEPYRDLFQKLDQAHPVEGRRWRDALALWQWGITDAALVSKMDSLGFQVEFRNDCGPFGTLPNFRKHTFGFRCLPSA